MKRMIGVGIKDITVTIELVLRGEEVHMKIATGKLTKKFCLLMIMIAIAFAMVLQSSEEVSAASNDGGKWLWPVQPQNKTSYAQNYKSYITCKYGERDGNSIHKAIDIAPTASTKYILAARAGTIYYAGWDNSLGYHVKIKHSGGYYSIYAHLSNIYVEKNQSVKTGDKIGYMGSTGDSTGTHLHFQITKNWTYAVGWTDNANMDKTVNTNPENLPYVFTPLSNNKYYIKYSDGLSSTTNDSSIIPTQTATRGVSITTTSKKFTREGYAYDYWYIYKLVNGKAYYWCRDKNTGGNAGFYAYDAIPSTHNKVKIAHGGSINFSVDAGTILYLRPVWEEDTYYIKYSDGLSSTINDSSIIPTQTATRGVSIVTTSKKFTREGYAYDYWYIYKLVNGKAYYWCRDKNTGGNAGFYAYDTIPSTHSKVKVAHGTSLVFSVDRGTTLYLTPAWVKGETSEIPSDKPEEDDVFSGKSIVRVAGQNRYGTATVAANAFRQITSANKFSNIIVASGADYADALAGSYLAKVKEAPILLVDDKYHLNMVKNYISKNLEENGTVYLLGGNAAVSSKFENSLKGMNVKRLGGANRYETNVSILKEAGVENEDLLVCTGANFADSLSASAVGKPIVLTSVRGISDSQKTYLKNAKIKDVYLIGGTGAVSNSVANQFKTYDDDGKTERISGANRYETSAAIAKKFFSGESKTVVLAYAMKFPDGLSGGPLAMSLDAPLLLVDGKRYNDAARYAKNAGVEKLVVMGGDTLITEKVVDRIIN